MSVEIKKAAIDIGIITKDIDAMMTFYGETLGLELEGSIPMPGGGTMNRFKVGDSVIKVIELDPAAPADAAPGGIRGAAGYRYWTITVGKPGSERRQGSRLWSEDSGAGKGCARGHHDSYHCRP